MARSPLGSMRVLAAGAISFFLLTTIAHAQSRCEPGHKFTPEEHARIIEEIKGNVGDVARNIDFRELTAENRDDMVLRAALAAPGIMDWAKSCIREAQNQNRGLRLSAPDAQELAPVLGGIRSANSVEQLDERLGSALAAANANKQQRLAAAIEAARRILNAGKERIYESRYYDEAAKKYGSRDPAVIARRMALRLAVRDLSDALIGGMAGALAGPEGAVGGACVKAIGGSASQVVVIFVELWLGAG